MTNTTAKRPKRHRETPEIRQTIRRFLAAYSRRVADGPGDLDELAEMVKLSAELDRVVAETARRLHAAGYSWTEIARPLGVTRQAARQRFGISDGAA